MTEATVTTDAWFVPCEGAARGDAVRVYVFPHAGAGPASLTALATACRPRVAVWSVNLPGRQARRHQPPRTDLEPLVAELARDLAARVRGPFALFGYCSGALLAHLVARRLVDAGVVPSRLFVGSSAAPDVAAVPRRLHRLPSEVFWEQLPTQGGAPADLAERVELRSVFEPALRADFALQAAHPGHLDARAMPVPVTVLYGRDDDLLTRGGLLGWRRTSDRPLQLCGMDASHWLIDDDPAAVVQVLVDTLDDRPAPGVEARREDS